MKLVQFLALVLTVIALIPAGAHFFELPNKLHLAESDYFVVQGIYRGWALFGIVLFGAVFANIALAVMLRGQLLPSLLVLVTLVCLVGSLAIFFAFTFPANQATSNWTQIPASWQQLRWQWEISHAVNAAINFVGFCALSLSLLLARD